MKKLAGYILTPIVLIAALIVVLVLEIVRFVLYDLLRLKVAKLISEMLSIGLMGCVYLLFNRVTFIDEQTLPVGRPIIFLPNHQGLFDVFPLTWYLRQHHPKFISKIELTRGIPTVSWVLRVIGGANIDRQNPRQALVEIAALGERMKKHKWSAIIFPEGTRSSNVQIKTFQTAGIAALLKKCPEALLVPIAINNSWKLIEYGPIPLGTFLNITFEVLTPIEPGNTPIEELVAKVEREIRAKVY